MIRIAFIDDDLDNYHANTYLRLARTVFQESVQVVGCTSLTPERGRTWAAANQIAWHDDAVALNSQVDAWMVLAPSTPAVHPELCGRVLPFGKPTWVDKTFAESHAVAKAIFADADRHGAPIQTSSALRYTNVQRSVAETGDRLRHVATWGGGRSFGEYAIHPVELAVSLLGHEAQTLHRRSNGDHDQLLVGFSGGRTATIHVHCTPKAGFAAALTSDLSTRWVPVDGGPMFQDAFAAACGFLATGVSPIDRRESLAVRAVLDAADDARALGGYVEVAR